MKLLLVLSVYIWSVLALNNQEVQQKWKEFQKTYGKTYRSTAEYRSRFDIFKKNLYKIEQHNLLYTKGLMKHEEGVTKFADWSKEEFLSYVNQSIKPLYVKKEVKKISSSDYPVPPSYDWRPNGTVTEVKDQGDCGSSWAFAAVGTVEGRLPTIKKEVVSLSAQNLIDCTGWIIHPGCAGGTAGAALLYMTIHGIETEEDYPYEARRVECRFDVDKSVAKVGGISTWSAQEDMLKSMLVNYGPIAIAIEATENLQLYKSGVLLDNKCGSQNLNHGALLVGYDEQDEGGYYVIKNSWGKDWGEDGFFRLGRMGHDPCGISQEGTYPDLE